MLRRFCGFLLAAGLFYFGCGGQSPDDDAENNNGTPGAGEGFTVTLMSGKANGGEEARYERAYLLGDSPERLFIKEALEDDFKCRWYSSPEPEGTDIINELEFNSETSLALERGDLMKIYYTYRGVLYYWVEVSGNGGTAVSNRVMITVSAPGRVTPAVSAAFPSVSTVSRSNTETLTLAAYAHVPPDTAGALEYEWFRKDAVSDDGRVSVFNDTKELTNELTEEKDGKGIIRFEFDKVSRAGYGAAYYYITVCHVHTASGIAGDVAASAPALVRVAPYITYMNGTDMVGSVPVTDRTHIRDGRRLPAPDDESVFTGWTTGPDNSGDYYAPGAVLTAEDMTDDITLYAVWSAADNTGE